MGVHMRDKITFPVKPFLAHSTNKRFQSSIVRGQMILEVRVSVKSSPAQSALEWLKSCMRESVCFQVRRVVELFSTYVALVWFGACVNHQVAFQVVFPFK